MASKARHIFCFDNLVAQHLRAHTLRTAHLFGKTLDITPGQRRRSRINYFPVFYEEMPQPLGQFSGRIGRTGHSRQNLRELCSRIRVDRQHVGQIHFAFSRLSAPRFDDSAHLQRRAVVEVLCRTGLFGDNTAKTHGKNIGFW